MKSWLVWGVALGTAAAACAQAPQSRLPRKVTCPVDYKVFDPTPQSPVIEVNGSPHYFCSAGCRDRLVAWPEKYFKGETVACTVQPNIKGHVDLPRRVELNNGLYYLCCEPCTGWLRDKPWLYLKELKDPVNGHAFAIKEGSPRSVVKGQVYLFESNETKAQFDREPQKYVIAFRR